MEWERIASLLNVTIEDIYEDYPVFNEKNIMEEIIFLKEKIKFLEQKVDFDSK